MKDGDKNNDGRIDFDGEGRASLGSPARSRAGAFGAGRLCSWHGGGASLVGGLAWGEGLGVAWPSSPRGRVGSSSGFRRGQTPGRASLTAP